MRARRGPLGLGGLGEGIEDRGRGALAVDIHLRKRGERISITRTNAEQLSMHYKMTKTFSHARNTIKDTLSLKPKFDSQHINNQN